MARLGVILFVVLYSTICFGQHTDSAVATLTPKTAISYVNGLSKKFNSLQDKIVSKTDKALKRLQQQENKLYRQLAKKDSIAAKKLFAEQQAKYAALHKKLHNAGTDSATATSLKQYLPQFDTLKTSLAFLDKQMSGNAAIKKELLAANQSLQAFEGKMQVANEIKKQLKDRKQLLMQQLQQYGMAKELKQLKKEVYYYQQQLEEYKALLKDREKLERKVIAMLRENKVFKNFMKQNSILAQLFKMPDDYGSTASLAGLQTRASLNNILTQRINAGGGSVQQSMQSQMRAAQRQMQSLRNQVNKLGGNSSSMDMPDFKPNTQKTKSFWQRLEYGLNFQTQKSKYMLPTTTDIGLSAGYKLNDKSVIGLGASYKVGWGQDINHLHISHQGVGLRSYVDIKLKGSFWISGGYEQNYQHEFTKYSQIQNLKAWQQSGLIGLTKKYKIGKQTNNLQILWDFLSYQQYPRTEAIKFRLGYKF